MNVFYPVDHFRSLHTCPSNEQLHLYIAVLFVCVTVSIWVFMFLHVPVSRAFWVTLHVRFSIFIRHSFSILIVFFLSVSAPLNLWQLFPLSVWPFKHLWDWKSVCLLEFLSLSAARFGMVYNTKWMTVFSRCPYYLYIICIEWMVTIFVTITKLHVGLFSYCMWRVTLVCHK